MSTLFTLTVTDQAEDTKQAEVRRVARALDLAGHAVRSAAGDVTSGNIIDEKGLLIGSWTYSGSATKRG